MSSFALSRQGSQDRLKPSAGRSAGDAPLHASDDTLHRVDSALHKAEELIDGIRGRRGRARSHDFSHGTGLRYASDRMKARWEEQEARDKEYRRQQAEAEKAAQEAFKKELREIREREELARKKAEEKREQALKEVNAKYAASKLERAKHQAEEENKRHEDQRKAEQKRREDRIRQEKLEKEEGEKHLHAIVQQEEQHHKELLLQQEASKLRQQAIIHEKQDRMAAFEAEDAERKRKVEEARFGELERVRLEHEARVTRMSRPSSPEPHQKPAKSVHFATETMLYEAPVDDEEEDEEEEDEESEDEEDVAPPAPEEEQLLEDLIDASPEDIATLPHALQEQVFLYRFMRESMALSEPTNKATPRGNTQGDFYEDEVRRESNADLRPSPAIPSETSSPQKPIAVHKAEVSLVDERELLGVGPEAIKLADDERRLLDELEELDRMERELEAAERTVKKPVAQIATEKELAELARASKAAEEEERRIREELALLGENLEDEAALEAEEAELQAIEELYRQTQQNGYLVAH